MNGKTKKSKKGKSEFALTFFVDLMWVTEDVDPYNDI